MPELPEVETVVRTLREYVLGQEIRGVMVDVKGERALGDVSPTLLAEKLVGRRFGGIQRHGKFIIFSFGAEAPQVVAHLRMTGRYLYQPHNTTEAIKAPNYLFNDSATRNTPLDPYIRFSLHLENGDLHYSDKRRFGTFHLVDDYRNYSGLKLLGLDALNTDFNAHYLLMKFEGRNKPIYSALLDQTTVAGLGNIYVCEVLLLARVHPLTPAGKITPKQSHSIVAHSKDLLDLAISNQGTSFSDYRNAAGEKGRFQEFLKVYGHKFSEIDGQSYEVARLKIGGRSVYFIPTLQVEQ